MASDPAARQAVDVVREIFALESRGSRELQLAQVMHEGRIRLFPHVEKKGLLFLQFKKNSVTVSAGPFIGLIPLNENVLIDVKPKMPVGNLARVVDISRLSLERIPSQKREYLLEKAESISALKFFASEFVESVRDAISSGVYKVYSKAHVVSSQPRGRVDIRATLRDCWSRGREHLVSTQRFRQTPNMPVNRAIKAALEYILVRAPAWGEDGIALVRLASAVHRGMPSEISSILPHDSRICRKIISEKLLPPSRHYYYGCLEMALAILENKSVSIHNDGDDLLSSTFIVNFETVFESYLRRSLHQHAGDDFWVRDGNAEGKKQLFDDKKDPPAQPDIVMIHKGTRRKIIAEVKYKEKPNRDDINQAITYGLSYKCDQVVLVHQCKDSGRRGLRPIGSIDGVRLNAYGFDLASSNLEVEEHEFSDCLVRLANSPDLKFT